jgi:predicted nucleic acid-binding protein
MTLIDSNVLIDVLTGDNDWSDWSASQFGRAANAGPVYFNEIVYSELAVKSTSQHDLDRDLRDLGLQFQPISKSALYLAGKVFGRYKAAGGTRPSNIPDFFIGAHAQIAGLPLLTRDVRRYRTYFPTVKLIAP